jgi:hypothetical protein
LLKKHLQLIAHSSLSAKIHLKFIAVIFSLALVL